MERVILRHLKGSKASQLEEFPLQQFAELIVAMRVNDGMLALVIAYFPADGEIDRAGFLDIFRHAEAREEDCLHAALKVL